MASIRDKLIELKGKKIRIYMAQGLIESDPKSVEFGWDEIVEVGDDYFVQKKITFYCNKKVENHGPTFAISLVEEIR